MRNLGPGGPLMEPRSPQWARVRFGKQVGQNLFEEGIYREVVKFLKGVREAEAEAKPKIKAPLTD